MDVDAARIPVLFSAIESGDVDVVQRLLDAGLSVDQLGPLHARAARGAPEATPLEAAAGAGHPALVVLLLKRGATLRSTTLHAALHGGPEIVRLLLDRGATTFIEARDALGRTPLLVAAQDLAEPLHVLQVLIEARPDLEARDALGHTAADSLAPEITAFLVDFWSSAPSS